MDNKTPNYRSDYIWSMHEFADKKHLAEPVQSSVCSINIVVLHQNCTIEKREECVRSAHVFFGTRFCQPFQHMCASGE